MPFDSSSTEDDARVGAGPLCRCDHLRGDHTYSQLLDRDTCSWVGCDCTIFAVSPPAAPPKAEGDNRFDPTCRCDHSLSDHHSALARWCVRPECDCRKFQAPAAPTDPPKAEEVCRCGHQWGFHVAGPGPGDDCVWSGCFCENFRPDGTPMCRCDHPRDDHYRQGSRACAWICKCTAFQAPEAPADPPEAEEKGHDFVGPDHCDECAHLVAMQVQQGRMIPRPEAVTIEAYPAPERRPPYSVAYAVQGGYEYEIAVPGDAMVIAEDGVLKILHYCRPVAGIVQIKPMREGDA